MQNLLKNRAYKTRVLILLMADIIAINMCSLIALLVRFDFRYSAITPIYVDNAIAYAPINTAVIVFIIWLCKLYSSVWSYASVNELVNIIEAVSISMVVQIIGMHYIFDKAMPRSYYVLYAIFLLCALTGLRFSYRFLRMMKRDRAKNKANVMIVGA